MVLGCCTPFIWEEGRGWKPRGGWGKCFGAVVQTQTSPRNLCKELGWEVCVPLPYVSYRNELKTNGYYSEEPSTRPLQHPTPRHVPQNPKTLCTVRNPGSTSIPCVRVNLSLYSGHLMSSIWIFILWRQNMPKSPSEFVWSQNYWFVNSTAHDHHLVKRLSALNVG